MRVAGVDAAGEAALHQVLEDFDVGDGGAVRRDVVELSWILAWAARAVQNGLTFYEGSLYLSSESLQVCPHSQRVQKLIRVGTPSVIISLQGLS